VEGRGRGSTRTPRGRRSSGMGGFWGLAWCTVGPLPPRIYFVGRGNYDFFVSEGNVAVEFREFYVVLVSVEHLAERLVDEFAVETF
jgi:hypothetical protein